MLSRSTGEHMIAENLPAAILRSQGYALFEYVNDDLFQPLGQPPSWWLEVSDENKSPERPVRLAERFPFIENFLVEAQEFWLLKAEGWVRSGIWMEGGRDRRQMPLECSALWLHERRLFLIQAVPLDIYEQQYRLFQTARQAQLSHSVELSHAHEQIDTELAGRKRAQEELQRSLEQLRALAGRLQRAREEERTRVAREIHDQLGQALTAIKMDLISLVQETPAGQKQRLKRTSSMLNLIDETIQSVRRISTELRPGILDDLGLVATVEWAGEEFETRTGTVCRLDLPEDDVAIDPETATALFRIFQETLTNVARHADASEVEVRLVQEDGDLTLEVHDNGKGITEGKLSDRESLGILGMRERALLLGGELAITGAPGKGTTVKVRIPATHRNLAGSRE